MHVNAILVHSFLLNDLLNMIQYICLAVIFRNWALLIATMRHLRRLSKDHTIIRRDIADLLCHSVRCWISRIAHLFRIERCKVYLVLILTYVL